MRSISFTGRPEDLPAWLQRYSALQRFTGAKLSIDWVEALPTGEVRELGASLRWEDADDAQ